MAGNATGAAATASSSSEPARLLDVTAAARYLSCSQWTIRDWIGAGLIRPVELPALRPREGDGSRQAPKTLRRILIDRTDLDQFIERCKPASAFRVFREVGRR
jgi:Helix-turn-helix domain